MQRKRMTNSDVDAFPRTAEDKAKSHPVLWDGEVKGFACRYSAKSGTRTYFLQYRVEGGAERMIRIGRHRDPWLVDQARARALELKSQMVRGIDPVAEAKQRQAAKLEQAKVDEAQTVTLRQLMERYVEERRTKHGPLRPATKASIRQMIEGNLSAWLDLPMATTITRDACVARFTELSDIEINAKTGKPGKKGAANMTFTYLRSLCHYARTLYEHTTDGTPRIFAANPVTRMVRVRKFNPEKPRTDRIPRDRMGAVFAMLRKRAQEARTDTERTSADWVSVVLLTGMRLTESASLKRDQVKLESRTLRLLGDVVKNHHDLVLPLSTTLHEILSQRMNANDDDSPAAQRRARQRSREYLFPGAGKKRPFITDARATMEAVSKVAGCHCSMHSLRRTYEDVLRYAKVDPDERRLLLNHIGGDVHQVSYSNSDDPETLRPAIQAAADWIVAQVRIAESSNVIPFPAKVG